jgi:hypothetical protein
MILTLIITTFLKTINLLNTTMDQIKPHPWIKNNLNNL